MTAILRLTIVEVARRRMFRVLGLLTLASVAVTAWGVWLLVDYASRATGGLDRVELALGVSQVLVLVAFMFSFVLAATAAFLAAPAIAGDLESGVALTMLARPVRRADLVLGRWLGLVLVVAGYAVVAGLLETAAVGVVTGYLPPNPLGASLQLALEGIVVLTLVLALSTRLAAIASGAIAVVAFGLAWMLGVLGGVGAFFGVPGLRLGADVGHVVLPTDLLWRGTIFALEPPLVVLAAGGVPGRALQANPFYSDAALGTVQLGWVAAWLAIVLVIAVVSFQRRDL